MHRMWRWLADRVLPHLSYTSHLHTEHGTHEHRHHDPQFPPPRGGSWG